MTCASLFTSYNSKKQQWDWRRWKVVPIAQLTPLCQFEGEFLVDETESHDEDEIDAGGRETGDDARLGPRPLVLEERDGDEDSVHDDGDDEDHHQHHLEGNTRQRWRRRYKWYVYIHQ